MSSFVRKVSLVLIIFIKSGVKCYVIVTLNVTKSNCSMATVYILDNDQIESLSLLAI